MLFRSREEIGTKLAEKRGVCLDFDVCRLHFWGRTFFGWHGTFTWHESGRIHKPGGRDAVKALRRPLLLAAGVLVGLFLNSVVVILKFAIVLLLVWGVPITVLFLWRRVTETAVRVQVFVTLLLIAVIPSIVSSVPSLARSERLTAMTRERVVSVEAEIGRAHV